jgi:lipopolysaccharide export system protein LptA
MAFRITRLRRWIAVTAVLFSAVVGGIYFYARLRQGHALKNVPGKIAYDIKQTASGFQFSKSEQNHTVFTIQAREVKEFKLNGRTELRGVSVILYGRDSSRYDQIYGDVFLYDPQSGDFTAKGDVQIDLEANPAGVSSPDQTMPKQLKNPIHLRTTDLVFNKATGNASTDAKVEFSLPQASGSGVGIHYDGQSSVLTLSSQVHIVLTGEDGGVIDAAHGVFTREPRQIVLDQPHMKRGHGELQAQRATFFIAADNTVERVLAIGGIQASTEASARSKATAHQKLSAVNGNPAMPLRSIGAPNSVVQARSDQAELLLTPRNRLRTAMLSGNVEVRRSGSQAVQGTAGRAVLDFSEANELKKIHAENGVRLIQLASGAVTEGSAPEKSTAGASLPPNFELISAVVDLFLTGGGQQLDYAETSGAAQIILTSPQDSILANNSIAAKGSVKNTGKDQRTVLTAGRFNAKFDSGDGDGNRLTSIHGTPDAKIVNIVSAQPDRVSTSQTLDAIFLATGGIGSITQQGGVFYNDGQAQEKRTQAWADHARYTPADQMLDLDGSPRVSVGSMATTARSVRINRATGDALAEGDVKSTYAQLVAQPDGALLGSASPVHVTAQSMMAHSSPATATYAGHARLWQDANLIQAPSIRFDRDHRSVTAQGTADQPVLTTLILAAAKPGESQAPDKTKTPQTVSQEKDLAAAKKPPANAPGLGKSSPVSITSRLLTYVDSERRAHYEGNVLVRGTEFTAQSKTVDAYLLPLRQTSTDQALTGQGRLDRMVAEGDVEMRQARRRAEGQKLVYTTTDDKFVVTGGPPSIFDAEHGKITGDSLTFFRRDDRVLVEGEASSPVVTQTRVAR